MICLPTNVAKTQDVPMDGTIIYVNTGQKDGPLLRMKIFLDKIREVEYCINILNCVFYK